MPRSPSESIRLKPLQQRYRGEPQPSPLRGSCLMRARTRVARSAPPVNQSVRPSSGARMAGPRTQRHADGASWLSTATGTFQLRANLAPTKSLAGAILVPGDVQPAVGRRRGSQRAVGKRRPTPTHRPTPNRSAADRSERNPLFSPNKRERPQRPPPSARCRRVQPTLPRRYAPDAGETPGCHPCARRRAHGVCRGWRGSRHPGSQGRYSSASTNSMTASSAASPRRGPSLVMRR